MKKYFAVIVVLMIVTRPLANAGLRQALQHYKSNDYLAAGEALKEETGEKADYIAGRALVQLTELYRKLYYYNLVYCRDYFNELEKGPGIERSRYFQIYKLMYDGVNSNNGPSKDSVRGSAVETGSSADAFGGLNELDKPAVSEDVERDKRLYFYDPDALLTAVGSLQRKTAGRFQSLRKIKGNYQGMATFYLGRLLQASDTKDREENLAAAKELFQDAASDTSLSAAYRGPARIYAAALDGGDVLAAAESDSYLKALALKLESERGGKDAQFVTVAEELRSKLAEEKNRSTFHLLGEYYLNIGAEEKALQVLEQARDKSNKNSIAHNDPVFMLDLARAYYLINRYDECLEILMALSEVFPGLRPLQNSVQGVYAARQKSAGEVRINQ